MPATIHTTEHLETIATGVEEAAASLQELAAQMKYYEVPHIDSHDCREMMEGIEHLRTFISNAQRDLANKLCALEEYGNDDE